MKLPTPADVKAHRSTVFAAELMILREEVKKVLLNSNGKFAKVLLCNRNMPVVKDICDELAAAGWIARVELERTETYLVIEARA